MKPSLTYLEVQFTAEGLCRVGKKTSRGWNLLMNFVCMPCAKKIKSAGPLHLINPTPRYKLMADPEKSLLIK